MNKIELLIRTDKGKKSVGIFDNITEVQEWIEKFYQISYVETKINYEKIRDESPTYVKYPALFIKEYTLDIWFQKMGVELIYKDWYSSSKRYDNGELITKSREEDEDWYGSLYQPFLTFVLGGNLTDVDETYNCALESFKEFFNEEFSDKDKERILRWSVLHCERGRYKPEFNFEN